jgi:hypothetical protein
MLKKHIHRSYLVNVIKNDLHISDFSFNTIFNDSQCNTKPNVIISLSSYLLLIVAKCRDVSTVSLALEVPTTFHEEKTDIQVPFSNYSSLELS